MEENKQPSYLSRIRFDPKLLNTFHAKYLKNIRLPILLVISIIIVGVFGYITIPRRLNPEIHIPIVNVNTVLPGANPEDVESLVTIPLERAITSVEGLDQMTSSSVDSNSNITLQFTSTTNTDKARNDVQAAVDTVTGLPDDAKQSSVKALDFENQPFWTFAITSKNNDVASLMRFSDVLKDRIESLSKVDRVETSGLEKQDIEVTIDLEKIKGYGISPLDVSQIVKTAAKSFPAGIVNSDASSFSLTINQDITSVDDIRNIQLKVAGKTKTPIRLGDIATIGYRSQSNQRGTYLATKSAPPGRVVQFFVFKKKGANIDAAFKDTEPVVKKVINEYNGTFSLFSVLNSSEEITTQFNDLFDEFKTTILLVFMLLLIFLGLRQAIIASITVPLTFLATFAIINQMGLTLNFLTMFSLLLALGLLIDDTIVTVAAMTRYYRTGHFTPYETAVIVWRDFIVPLWSTTITTIWAFVPLLLSTGIIGEFIKSIPIVVTISMLSSTTIAVLVTMPLMIIFLKPEFPRRVTIFFWILGFIIFTLICFSIFPKNTLFPVLLIFTYLVLFVGLRVRKPIIERLRNTLHSNTYSKRLTQKSQKILEVGLINIEGLSHGYRKVIDRILSSNSARRKTLIAIIAFAVLAYLLLPLGFIRNEFFPKQDADIIYIGVELPPGASIIKTTDEAQSLLNDVRNTEFVRYGVADVGTSIGSDGNRAQNANSILITLNLVPHKKRHTTSVEIGDQIRKKYANYVKGKFSVIDVSGGPPAGADVQVNLIGEDLKTLDGYADTIVAFMEKQKGLTNIDKSIKPGTSKIVFVPDKAKMADAGVTADSVGLWLRTYATGFTLESVRFGKKDKDDIVFRTTAYDQQGVDALSNIEIPVKDSKNLPLLSLGSLHLETNPTVITRKDEKRTISVFASVTKGYTTTEKNTELLNFVKKMNFQEGYGYETGGVNEENQKSVASIVQAMLLSFLLILITMVLEFGSFRQAFIAMALIPISIAGVFYIFALTRTPLSFAALIGVLALFGIVVTHAIVVIEKINENRAHDLPLKDAITDAAANRLEPVLLTSLATIVGLLPITIADPFWRGLGGTIIAGLLFSGALKLFFVPVLYYNFYHKEEEEKKPK